MACRLSTNCTRGHGATTPMARLWTGIPKCAAIVNRSRSAPHAALLQPPTRERNARVGSSRRNKKTNLRRNVMTKRLLFFGYGMICYLIFLATFLYAIAFVGGFLVPARLDGPLGTTVFEAVAIDCVLLTI